MAGLHPTLLKLVGTAVTDFFMSSDSAADVVLVGGDAKADDMKEDLLYSASLGFASPQIKGALVVTTTDDVLAASNPQREFKPEFAAEEHRDWIGEMANQIVGNLKRLVAGYGLAFSLGTPTVVSGRDLATGGATKTGMQTLQFQVRGSNVKIQIAAEIDGSVDFDKQPEETGQAGTGDAFLF